MACDQSGISIPLEELAGTWELAADRLDAFLAAWDQHKLPPNIADFLPDTGADRRRLILIELLKADLS